MNLTVEVHHVIPVAWQLAWLPSNQPFPGTDPDGRGHLWDARTVALCPTGHRNVHALIVELMKRVAAGAPPRLPERLRRKEYPVAQLALERFEAVGGDLQTLVAVHQWGQSLPAPHAPR